LYYSCSFMNFYVIYTAAWIMWQYKIIICKNYPIISVVFLILFTTYYSKNYSGIMYSQLTVQANTWSYSLGCRVSFALLPVFTSRVSLWSCYTISIGAYKKAQLHFILCNWIWCFSDLSESWLRIPNTLFWWVPGWDII